MDKMIFITGGCRSGKSRFGLDYANRNFRKKAFLATSRILDEEMALRVENHRKMRGPEWQTIEEPVKVVESILQLSEEVEVLLLDCITLWISNLMERWEDDRRIFSEAERLLTALRKRKGTFLIVSNEVGMGVVPATPLGRRFRDVAGAVNQRIAGAADVAVLMVSGIPLLLKGEA
jgi:adenosylcobinamide kinase/adenosylcobinamide-phosphate guanylyltransferase